MMYVGMRRQRGFTLIELLVVITIMSILTVITVSQFVTAKKKARDVARKGDINSAVKALQMYFADYGYFPTSSGGKMVVDGTTVDWGGEFKDAANYIYMKVLPRENFLTTKPYCYAVRADRKAYALFAQLENSQDSECNATGYVCNGVTYCYSVVSPNINKGDL